MKRYWLDSRGTWWRLFILLVLNVNPGWPAFSDAPLSTAPLGMGYATTAVTENIHAIYTNPAALAQMYGMAASMDYTQRYGLSELAHTQIMGAVSTNLGAIGLSYNQLGEDLYQERLVVGTYAYEVRHDLSLGLSLRGYQLDVAQYGESTTFGVDAGILLRPRPEVRLGFKAHNLNRPEIGVTHDPLPHSLTLGVAYVPRSNVVVGIDAFKDLDFPISYRAGVEYKPVPALALRAGVQTEPGQFSVGAGFYHRFLQIDYARVSHPKLGETNYWGLMIHWAE
ncbi:MAG: hypothetical protein D6675_11890 [Gemmatimonadetes bacterium]|nr:MAG: hypothetical protein D6675_11890 [Gemmatimonadota bacterium]